MERAKDEPEFKRAVDSVKDAIPETLLIKGHNPLILLHGALSVHLHEKSDAECLALAQDIRIVLAELAEKISTALRDNAELNNALSRLMNPRSKQT